MLHGTNRAHRATDAALWAGIDGKSADRATGLAARNGIGVNADAGDALFDRCEQFPGSCGDAPGKRADWRGAGVPIRPTGVQ